MPPSEIPLEIDIDHVTKLLKTGEDFLFLDCREAAEYDTAKIDGTTLLPMSEIQERLPEILASRDQRVVVHCHHGGRSLRVAKWLRGQGFDHAQSMAGGIDAWSLEVDPNVPRY